MTELILGVLGTLIGLWLLLLGVLWVVRPRDVRVRDMVRLVPDVLRLVRQLISDRSTPMGVRLALVGLFVWLVNPIDLVPEFIPVLGPLDDVLVAILVLRYARRRLGEEELARRWPGTPSSYRLLDALLSGGERRPN